MKTSTHTRTTVALLALALASHAADQKLIDKSLKGMPPLASSESANKDTGISPVAYFNKTLIADKDYPMSRRGKAAAKVDPRVPPVPTPQAGTEKGADKKATESAQSAGSNKATPPTQNNGKSKVEPQKAQPVETPDGKSTQPPSGDGKKHQTKPPVKSPDSGPWETTGDGVK